MTQPSREPPTNGSNESFERPCAYLALVLPFVATVITAGAASDWRGDLSAVTGLGVLPLGSEGWLGLVGAQASALLPLGGRWLRGAFLGALAAAVVGRLLYGLCLRLLAASAPTPSLSPPLALAAALMAVLSPTFQAEGAGFGGAALATASALAALSAYLALPPRDARTGIAVGALFALTAVESHASALALALALLAAAVARGRVPVQRELAGALAGALGVLGLVAAGLALRVGSPHAWLDLGFGLGQSSLSDLSADVQRRSSLAAWLDDVGVVAFGLAVGGAALGALRRATRPLVLPLAAFVAVDVAFPSHAVGALSADPSAPARLLGLSALAVAAALGVQSAALGLFRARLPFATPAAVLLVVFDFTLVLVAAEASATQSERNRSALGELWTDEALASLPPESLILSRSEAVAYRLWAAQLVRGERPDVIIVPTTLLGRGGLRRRLVGAEPALAPLLRDVALSGRPGEYALSTLADARPLFVELDPSWDERLSQHLAPAAFWLRFSAHPMGRSDRTLHFRRAERRLERVSQAVVHAHETGGAPATRAVLLGMLRQRGQLLTRHRDREMALQTAEALRGLAPEDDVAAEIARRFPERPTAQAE